jgi:hypothetical protein
LKIKDYILYAKEYKKRGIMYKGLIGFEEEEPIAGGVSTDAKHRGP